uniref:NADH dehydrogenase subunit 5 n=1 Tax=Discus perspectivus TaxID=697275 RepID=UPI002176A33C|nr:NADH dehydrogenase subunit 5 [Discus perspectivus]UUB71737.1 NADH dehydrogenase subunit 5 [Discus perspectivus]
MHWSPSKYRWPLLLVPLTIVVFLGMFNIAGRANTYIVEYVFYSTPLSFSFIFLFDKFSTLFTCVVLLISLNVFLFACEYMTSDKNFSRFMWILGGFVLSMILLILGGSYISLLVGWDGLGVSSFFLIIYYQSGKSLSAGFMTLLINRVGDILIMLGLYFLWGGGSLGMYSPLLLGSAFLTITGYAALTKSAQYPFSVWLPAAMAAPTPVSALVHSSTLVTAGVYLIFRLNHTLGGQTLIFLFCGALTCFLGGAAALYENDLKKIIALSTLSQLGVMMFSLGLGMWYLSLFHLMTHAMFKAMLFLVGGLLIMKGFGSQDIRGLGNSLKGDTFLTVFFIFCVLSLGGLPFVSAYLSKHLILEAMFSHNINMMSCFVFLLGSALTVSYSFRLLYQMLYPRFLSSPPLGVLLKPYSYLPMVLLSFFTLCGGSGVMNLGEMTSSTLVPPEFNIFMLLFGGLGFLMFFTAGLYVQRNKVFLYTLFFSTNMSMGAVKFLNLCATSVQKMNMGWIEPCSLNLGGWKRFSWLLHLKMGWLYVPGGYLRPFLTVLLF